MPHSFRLAALAVLIVSGCSRGPADDVIATQIKAKFFSDPAVRMASLSVAVNKGKVTLSGSVPSAEAQLQAFKLATYTDGVAGIDDQMVLKTAAPAETKPGVPPVELYRERQVVSAPPVRRFEAAQEQAVPVAQETVPELRPPGGPRTRANVRIGGLRVPVVAKVAPEALPPVEPEVVYDPAVAVIAAGPADRGRGSRGLFVVGPAAAAPLYQRWFADFSRPPDQAQLTYETAGQGSGIERLIEGRADLTATDVPASDEQIAASRRGMLHFPAVVDGVVLICNLSGILQEVNFSGDVLGAILSGRIAHWNDPLLGALNPQTALPAADISLVHRSDSSGTTLALTDFLSKTSPSWRFGSGPAIGWPRGIGVLGDDGVAALIRQTPNSLGYVDAAFALQHRLPFGAVRNMAGRPVKASAGSLTAAAAAFGTSFPADFRASIVNAPGASAYPIAALNWLLAPDRLRDRNRRDIAAFLSWSLVQGQRYAAQFGYGALPQDLVIREVLQVGRIR